MKHKCAKCGHVGPAAMYIPEIEGWRDAMTAAGLGEVAETMAVLAAQSVAGETGDGTPFRTLFLSTLERNPLVATLLQGQPVKTPEFIFRERLIPVIKTIAENFVILGTLARPSVINLAITGLSEPYAVYCFLTVKDEPGLEAKLKSLGLERVLSEGLVDTIDGKRWIEIDNE